jgi:ribosomal protein RSM22 (predicted rRNA methylase)
VDVPPVLREALQAALAGQPVAELADAVAGLMARYRTPQALDDAPEPGPAAILAGPVEVAAYAAYRMPATYAAVRSALAALPTLRPLSLLDLGGGTGAAAWAATDVFPGLAEVTVLDRFGPALELGRRLGSARPVLARARWQEWTYGPQDLPGAPAELVTISYLLGELPARSRWDLVTTAARGAHAVVVVEPGTPAGHARVLGAREALLAVGMRIVAPCPHQASCPLAAPDWCHFATRVNRSALHRRVKRASLGYEDEKFSYVAALASTAAGPAPIPARQPASRVLRRPLQRKGVVQLRLCTPSGAVASEIVSKRQGERYRFARDLAWGDPWLRD